MSTHVGRAHGDILRAQRESVRRPRRRSNRRYVADHDEYTCLSEGDTRARTRYFSRPLRRGPRRQSVIKPEHTVDVLSRSGRRVDTSRCVRMRVSLSRPAGGQRARSRINTLYSYSRIRLSTTRGKRTRVRLHRNSRRGRARARFCFFVRETDHCGTRTLITTIRPSGRETFPFFFSFRKRFRLANLGCSLPYMRTIRPPPTVYDFSRPEIAAIICSSNVSRRLQKSRFRIKFDVSVNVFVKLSDVSVAFFSLFFFFFFIRVSKFNFILFFHLDFLNCPTRLTGRAHSFFFFFFFFFFFKKR